MWFLIGTIKRRTRGVITFPYILHLRGQRKKKQKNAKKKNAKITQQKTYNCTYTYIRPPFWGTRVVEVDKTFITRFYHGLTHCSSSTLFLNNRKAHISHSSSIIHIIHNEIWYFESHLLATSDVELIKQHLRLIIDKVKGGECTWLKINLLLSIFRALFL